MMDDIVGLLLDRAFRLATRDFNGDGARLAKEAADEILRLRAENEKLRAALVGAKDMLEFWSFCVSDYFKEKHGLSNDLAYIAAVLKETGE